MKEKHIDIFTQSAFSAGLAVSLRAPFKQLEEIENAIHFIILPIKISEV